MNKYEVVVEKVYIYTRREVVEASCMEEAEKKVMAKDASNNLMAFGDGTTPEVKTSFTAKEV